MGINIVPIAAIAVTMIQFGRSNNIYNQSFFSGRKSNRFCHKTTDFRQCKRSHFKTTGHSILGISIALPFFSLRRRVRTLSSLVFAKNESATPIDL
jgi:hypothetical protein